MTIASCPIIWDSPMHARGCHQQLTSGASVQSFHSSRRHALPLALPAAAKTLPPQHRQMRRGKMTKRAMATGVQGCTTHCRARHLRPARPTLHHYRRQVHMAGAMQGAGQRPGAPRLLCNLLHLTELGPIGRPTTWQSVKESGMSLTPG